MNKIYISNEQDKFEVTKELKSLIRKAVNKALKFEEFPRDAEVSVTLTDDENIHSLNKEYRNIDRATDVLSFPLYTAEEINDMYSEEYEENADETEDEENGYQDEESEEDLKDLEKLDGYETEEELPEEKTAIGDIVISLERADAQSKEYGHSFERETAFLCVHSVLHLLGYDHELGKAEEEEMFSRQEAILKKMKLER